MKQESIIGIIFIALGLLFFLNNKNISRGTAKLYQKIYTEENLKIMFKAAGIILILGGIVLIYFK